MTQPNCELKQTDAGLSLHDLTGTLPPLHIDYLHGQLGHRNAQPGGTELIAKAVRIKHLGALNIWDFTGGLGKDGFRLATLGHTVTLIEQHPILATMVQEALARTSMRNILCHHIDASQWCAQSHATAPHVVVIDPMFPKRQKSASVSAPARWLQRLVGPLENGETLLRLALQHATHRIVIKRPKTAPPIVIDGHHPTGKIQGKQMRFDLYAAG